MALRKPTTSNKAALIAGYRSGLEEQVAGQLESLGVEVKFEQEKLTYTIPAKEHTYTPDFKLPNGIFIETKGRFVTADRQKHLHVKRDNPGVDIRFVFSNSRSRLSKLSKTTYAMWAEKYGFKFADKLIPLEWIRERVKKTG